MGYLEMRRNRRIPSLGYIQARTERVSIRQRLQAEYGMRDHNQDANAHGNVQICEPTTLDELGTPFPHLETALESTEHDVVLDLSALATIDTVTMTRILEAAQTAHEHGKAVRLTGCTEEVYTLLRFYKIDKFVHMDA
jgi:ABC-type transporter Mla MlaB component